MKISIFFYMLFLWNRFGAEAYFDEEHIIDTGDYNHNLNFAHQLSLNDWDASLYGKPICTNIPSNMSLCANINYNQMKVPNLIGHEDVEEVCKF